MKRGILLLTGLCFMYMVKAQRVYDTTTANIMGEVSRLEAAINTASHLGFNAVYYYQDVDSVVVYDTMNFQYKINGNNFHIDAGSMETIQNEKFLVSVYHDDSTVVVQSPIESLKRVFPVDVQDTLFQQLAMSGMTASDSGTYRKIVLQFDQDAIYTNYEIVYDKNNNRISYIMYSLRKELEIKSSKRINMRIVFSNYSTDTFSDSVFATDPFVKVMNSKELKSGTATTNFDFINMLNE